MGAYLTFHFCSLISYAEELFGNQMPFDPTLSPTYHIFPNILSHVNARPFIIFLSFVSLLFTFGIGHCLCPLILWYGWAALLNRNVLIHNPGIPYIGWILFACAILSITTSNSSYQKNNNYFKRMFSSDMEKNISQNILIMAWILMGLGYTISGLHKLQCPSWIDGTALIHILNGPIARDNFIRDFMISLPPIFLKISAWGSLGLEILFLPLGMFYHTRFPFWIAYMVFHIGVLLMINFTDLTLGVMMIHFFTFDERWLRQYGIA